MIYPNPTDGNFRIKLEDPSLGGNPFLVEIYNLSGQLLFRDITYITDGSSFQIGEIKGTVTIRISQKGVTGSCVVIIP